MNQIDLAIFLWLNSWVGISQFFDWAIWFRTVALWYIMIGTLVLFILFSFLPKFRQYLRRNVEMVIFAFASAAVARLGVAEIIRFFYNRPRPFETLEGARQLIEHSGGGSFPSGHASLSFAVAAAVYFYYPKTSILFFFAALSIGVGRVAAGLHWPSDILGGAAVGILSAWLLEFLFKKFKINKSPEN